jgi:protein-disulfide isomerase
MINHKVIKSLGLVGIGLVIGVFVTLVIFYSSKSKNEFISNSFPLLGKPLVNIDGKIWTSADLPDDSLRDYYNLENNVYNSEKYFSEQLALRIILANEMGKKASNESIPKLSELLIVPPIKDEDALKYYNSLVMRAGIGVFGGQSFEKVKSQLIVQLNQEQLNNISNKKIEELTSNKKIKLLFSAPSGTLARLDTSLFPMRGNDNSRVTLVSVLDYMDPRSREIEPELEKLYKDYASKINFINIAYSISPNGLGAAFAKGAYCAKEQGNKSFWNYNEKSFEKPMPTVEENGFFKDSKQLNKEVIEVAQHAKLDMDKFTSCVNSGRGNLMMQKVQNQLYSFNSFQGTPTFYLNRRTVQVSLKELDSKLRNELN